VSEPDTSRTEPHGAPARRPHHWLMMACCVPMLVIAIGLLAAGVVSAGLLLAAVGCTAMMYLMMRGMDHGEADRH
jgi:drug/metabolite transporter (DMT)-like permease